MMFVQMNPEESDLSRVTEAFRKHWETLEGEPPPTHTHTHTCASAGQRQPFVSRDLCPGSRPGEAGDERHSLPVFSGQRRRGGALVLSTCRRRRLITWPRTCRRRSSGCRASSRRGRRLRVPTTPKKQRWPKQRPDAAARTSDLTQSVGFAVPLPVCLTETCRRFHLLKN